MNYTTKTNPLAPATGSAAVDERVAFLSKLKTDVLVALMQELVEPFDIGCSRNFFLLGMDRRFRETQPLELFDLIVAVLRERSPNRELSHGAKS